MKTTILIKEDRTQLVLHPESDHDKDALKILEKLPNTYRADLYNTQGGWTQFSEYADKARDLMIVFETKTKKEVSDLLSNDFEPPVQPSKANKRAGISKEGVDHE